jgi:hypothetical protein
VPGVQAIEALIPLGAAVATEANAATTTASFILEMMGIEEEPKRISDDRWRIERRLVTALLVVVMSERW